MRVFDTHDMQEMQSAVDSLRVKAYALDVEPKDGDVRQRGDEWQEFVNGRWWNWNDRPLCSCKIMDDGDGESGPHLVVVEWSPTCARHPFSTK